MPNSAANRVFIDDFQAGERRVVGLCHDDRDVVAGHARCRQVPGRECAGINRDSPVDDCWLIDDDMAVHDPYAIGPTTLNHRRCGAPASA